MENKRTKCLVYSRVNGWYVPTTQMNAAKVSEYKDRQVYEINQETNKEVC